MPRIGTLILRGSPLEFLPLHRGDRFPRSTQGPESESRHLYAGRHPGSKQVSPGLILVYRWPPVLTSSSNFRHLIGWFACARLSDPQLIPSSGTFSSTLTTVALYQCSLRCFEACSCKPTPRGQTLISCAASWRTTCNLSESVTDLVCKSSIFRALIFAPLMQKTINEVIKEEP